MDFEIVSREECEVSVRICFSKIEFVLILFVKGLW